MSRGLARSFNDSVVFFEEREKKETKDASKLREETCGASALRRIGGISARLKVEVKYERG